tara:strand:- start:2557 stop:3228 length:672 start_codon:yes stop_codon:yes gene_type:complete
MAEEYTLDVSKRDLTNKGGIKQMRKSGKVPGIYYSFDSKSSTPFFINIKDLRDAQKSGSRIFNINVGSKKRTVLFKSVQYHPVTDEILHIDLYGIKMDQAVTVNVSVTLIGTPKGVQEQGGTLVQGLNELEIECLPGDIPETIEVEIESLEIGDSIRVEDLKKIDKFEVKTPSEQILASVTQAQQDEVEESAESGESGEDAADGSSEESSDDNSEADNAKDSE